MAASPDTPESVSNADILGRIASFLPPNEIACTLRLVSRSTAEQFREHTVVRLSQPSPAAAFAAHWSAPGACRAISRKRRLQLLCLTAAAGDVANLEVALAAAGLCPKKEVMAVAASAGQLHVCRCLAERGCLLDGPTLSASPLNAAAKGGHAAVCEWLLEQGCDWIEECVTSAAAGGHPELMRALLRKAPPGVEVNVTARDLMLAAAEGCELGTLQELWPELAVEDSAGSLVRAARSPTPDWAAKVTWLLEQGAMQRRDPIVVNAAASCPDGVARLTLLVEGMGFPVNASALDLAIVLGRADVVRWLLARGLRPRPGQGISAAQMGHTEVLRALHAAGCQLPPPKSLVARACTSGSVEAVSWVVETFGAEALQAAGPKAFDEALKSGSLELVTWLRERGLGLSSDSWSSAAMGGCVAVLELLAEWGAEVQAPFRPVKHPYLAAAGHGDLLTLEALRRLDLPLGRTQQERKALVGEAIALKAPLPALRWLRRAVGEVDWAAAGEAARITTLPAGWRAEVRAWVQAEAEAERGSGSGRSVRGVVGEALATMVRWATRAKTGAAGRE